MDDKDQIPYNQAENLFLDLSSVIIGNHVVSGEAWIHPNEADVFDFLYVGY